MSKRWIGSNFEELIRLAEEEEAQNKLLTITQVSKILQVSVATVRRLLRTGQLPFIDITAKGEMSVKAQRVALEDLNQFISNRRRIWSSKELVRITQGSEPLMVNEFDAVLERVAARRPSERPESSKQNSKPKAKSS